MFGALKEPTPEQRESEEMGRGVMQNTEGYREDWHLVFD